MLDVTDLQKTYRAHGTTVQACRGLAFRVDAGEILSLVGPSGCGKTTALRCVAGLERPDGGRITLGDRILHDAEGGEDLPPHRRPVGMVFQSYAIWPHLSVAGNVGYALDCLPRRERPAKTDRRRRVLEALDRVRIADLADRPASALSGGQQQRVAIARALLRGADLLLFDEPLSNLDAKLREEMRSELRVLFKQADLAVLYVTHDLGEALAISDRLLVLHGGHIVQEGRPEEIYRRPRTEFVAGFLGNANLVPGQVVERHGDRGRVETVLGQFDVDTSGLGPGAEDALLLVRPSELRVETGPPPVDGGPVAVVEASLFLGSTVEYRVRIGAIELRACGDPGAGRAEIGDLVSLVIDPAGVVAIPRADATASLAAEITAEPVPA